MDVIDFIKTKQICWARKNGFELMDSEGGDRGRDSYVSDIENNYFQGLNKGVIERFKNADGGELAGDVAKMQALHSSAALAVNVFKYWQDKNLKALLYWCKLCDKQAEIDGKLFFERKFEIDESFSIDPNIDVVIENTSSLSIDFYAIESKFSEPYYDRNGSKGIKEKYMELDIWQHLPNLERLADEICPVDNKFEYLHAAQLIKHTLGLKLNASKSRFRLLYLFYDVPGPISARHRAEINEFREIAKADNINFHYLSYQKLIVDLAKEFYREHQEYIEYITDRYL